METQRCKLRRCTEAMLDDYHLLMSDMRIVRFITGRGLGREEARQRLKKLAGSDPRQGIFLVYGQEKGDLLGMAKFLMNNEGEMEIGYLLAVEHWGKGLATEIAKLLVREAKLLPDVKVIFGLVDARNLASIRVLEKCGMKLISSHSQNGAEIQKYALQMNY
ncbi:MAG: GNAT family N-acetyltransferase [Cyclobacteriaceae bacterium]